MVEVINYLMRDVELRKIVLQKGTKNILVCGVVEAKS